MPIPQALKGDGTRVRVVGTRRFPPQKMEVEEGLSSALGGLCDEEVHASVGSRRLKMSPDRKGSEQRLLEATPPSVIGLASVYLEGFRRAGLVERILCGERLVVLGRYSEGPAWMRLYQRAMTTAIRQLALEHDAGAEFEVHDQKTEAGESEMDISSDVEQSLEFLGQGHLLALARKRMPVDPVILALACVTVDLDPSLGIMQAALHSVHPDVAWPEDLVPEDMTPRILDVSLRRAETAEGAIDLMRLVSRALRAQHVKEEEILERATEQTRKAEEKKSTASKKSAVEVFYPSTPKLQDLSGYGKAALWAEDLVTDLHEYAVGCLRWSDVDGAALLVGPPGTGKTMFASALAASAGMPFIPTSYADWQGYRDGHLGTLISRMRDVFAEANRVAPCILFIDEVDAIASRGSTGSPGGRHDDWWSSVVAALLEQLDGTVRREGVVVVAACNHGDKLDPALTRSGRLDRRFDIRLPDGRALRSIFAHHLPGADPAAFEPAAVALAGTISGADVARFAREARRVARRQDRGVEVGDIMSLALPPDRRSPELRRLAAVHESGHAIAGMLHGRIPLSMSVVERAGMHGGVSFEQNFDCGRLSDVEGHVVTLLAGRAAEDVIIGVVSGGSGGMEGSDLANATNLVGAMMGALGLGTRLAVGAVSTDIVEERLQALYRRAIDLMSRHRADVEALADIVGEKRVLSRTALVEFAKARGIGR